MNERRFLKELVGKPEEEVVNLCKDNGYTTRVVKRGQTNFGITMDLHFDRVNLEINNGIVVNCDIG